MKAGQHKLLVLTGCTDSSVMPVTVNHGTNDNFLYYGMERDTRGSYMETKCHIFFLKPIFELAIVIILSF